MLIKPLSDAADALATLGNQRVWSLLVTIFGDLAQNDGDVIEGPTLSTLMADMKVKPEATRVALHRLRKDKWVTSIKKGRASHHSLTESGRSESAAASPRIYGQPEDIPKHWQLVILDGAESQSRKAMTQLGFSWIMPRVYVGSTFAKAPDDALILSPKKQPDWLVEQIEPKDLVQDYATLHQALWNLKKALAQTPSLSPRETAVLRALILHSWRRLVLKHPELPSDLYSANWHGHDCRVLVSGLLSKLPKPDLDQISLD